MTFGENIMLGRPDGGRLARVIDEAELAEAVGALPAGVDTLLTREFEGGTDLSGGQWQRLAVARALVDEEADVVVLDEASSNLDPVAEARLVHTVKRLCRDKLVVIVSHRLSSIAEADRVLVLDHGRVVERGSPLELLAAEGAFARMFSVQAKALGLPAHSEARG